MIGIVVIVITRFEVGWYKAAGRPMQVEGRQGSLSEATH